MVANGTGSNLTGPAVAAIGNGFAAIGGCGGDDSILGGSLAVNGANYGSGSPNLSVL